MKKIEPSNPEELFVMVNVRMTLAQREAIEQAAKRSGWKMSEQIRYELFEPRGMWKMESGPYRPYKVVKTETLPEGG